MDTLLITLGGVCVLLLFIFLKRRGKRKVIAPVVGESKVTMLPLAETSAVRKNDQKRLQALDKASDMLNLNS